VLLHDVSDAVVLVAQWAGPAAAPLGGVARLRDEVSRRWVVLPACRTRSPCGGSGARRRSAVTTADEVIRGRWRRIAAGHGGFHDREAV